MHAIVSRYFQIRCGELYLTRRLDLKEGTGFWQMKFWSILVKPEPSSRVWLFLNFYCGEHLVSTSGEEDFVGRILCCLREGEV